MVLNNIAEQTEHDKIQAEIHREHGLLSNRMSWYVSSQAFLVGAFAVGGNNGYTFRWMSYFVPVVGIVITTLILLSILGGLLAMTRLRKQLSYNCFGAPRYFHWLGVLPLWAIPSSLLVTWIIALNMV